MAVHVDEISSDVSVEPPSQSGSAASAESDWESLARLKEQRERMMRDAWRTASEGYDD